MTPTPTPMQPEQMPQGIAWETIAVALILVLAVTLLVLSMFRQVRRIQVPRTPNAPGTQNDAIRLAAAGERTPEPPRSPDEAAAPAENPDGTPDGDADRDKPDGHGLADPGTGR
ncbi:hypothetical protein [Granulicoccus phenolivorans]|uniref:hypothetical protein n=1 Tax=Granulicoccus phenolivorans TaxID=266854 RepID=UPI0003F4D5ED|nr:hypothetical protein [Granulicoccus phenolivorans]